MTAKLGRGLACAGGGLAAVTTAWAAGFSALSVPFILWSAIPYAVLWGLSGKAERPGPVLGAGLAALAGEAAVRAAVFLWPENSTAAVALAVSPAYVLFLLMPAGAGLGFVLGEAWEKSGAFLRGAILLAAAGALVFEFFAIAAPEKLPMNAVKSKAARERIGAPRVVVAGAFEDKRVSEASAWHQALDVDGAPGDELAVIDHRGAQLYDLDALSPARFVPFPGEPGRLWSWMSQLVPFEAGLAVAQTGGGFSETRLQRLDGTTLWTYQPDANLKPTAMAPADLQRDGTWEFYAASNEKLARLDLGGRETWAYPARSPHLLAALPGWVAAYEYGKRAFALDADGKLLGEHALSPKDMPFSAADTPWGRAFLHGGKKKPLRGIGLDGRELFSLPLGDFTAIQAVGLTFKSGPALAVSADTTKDVGLSRVLIVGAGGTVLYDEVLAKLPVLRAARRPDGTSVLLLSGPGLRVLRPKS